MAPRDCGRCGGEAQASTQSDGAGRAQLRRQLLPAVSLGPEPDRLGDPRPGEVGGVPGPVGQLVEKGRVAGLRGGRLVRSRHDRDRGNGQLSNPGSCQRKRQRA